jgi:SAM-dependent methyltransferase
MTNKDSRKLNLGCGAFTKEGYVNVDHWADYNVDVRHDLEVFPYPFESGSFDLIEADHVLEHLRDPFSVFKECHRLLAPGGILKVRVPHFSRGFSHPEHKRGFDVTLPLYFNPSFRGGYRGFSFLKKRIRLTWNAQPWLKRTVLPLPLFLLAAAAGALFDLFANISPVLCSRVWCFWVGGFEEILFVLQKPAE